MKQEVIVSLELDSLGKVQDISLLKGITYGSDQVSKDNVAALSSLGYTPAVYNGNVVKVKFEIPVKFNIP